MKNKIQKLLATFILVVFIPGITLFAGNNPKFKKEDATPILLIGVGLGINDYGFGLGLEAPIMKNLSVYGDLGVGGWGSKVGMGFNYHFQQITKGSVISLGISHGSGLKGFETDMMVEPSGDQQRVKLDLNPVNTVNIKYTYNIKLGSKSKFGISAGYSIPFTTDNYKVLTPGVKLTPESETVLNMMQPGGLIFGFRFLFGIGTKD